MPREAGGGGNKPTTEPEKQARAAQVKDIAARTQKGYEQESREAISKAAAKPGVPFSAKAAPTAESAHYAVEALKGNVAERMRKQGEEATLKAGKPMSFQQGGTVPKTGEYKLHEGEKVIPKKQVQTGVFPSAELRKPPSKIYIHPPPVGRFENRMKEATTTAPKEED
jgi:hypothetical protein